MGQANIFKKRWEEAAAGRRCDQCKHFGPPRSEDDTGRCRKYAATAHNQALPSRVGGIQLTDLGVWAPVPDDGWCSEHEPMVSVVS